MRIICFWACVVTLLALTSVPAFSQEDVPSSRTPDVVYVDPGQFLPETLSKRTSGDDRTLALHELPQLLMEEHPVDVRIDAQSLRDERISPESRGSWLGGVPLYAALDQFCESYDGIRLDWYLDGDVVVITTAIVAQHRRVTRAIDVAPSIDNGLSPDLLSRLLEGIVLRASGEYGGPPVVGNVMHLNSSFNANLKAESLIAGLHMPGRIRYLDQTKLNRPLHEALTRPVQIPEGPYSIVHLVQELEQVLDIEMWIDERNLSDEGIATDEVVQVPGRPIMLDQLVENVAGIELAFVPKNGRLWLIPAPFAEEQCEAVIYDISDLLTQDATLDDFIDGIPNLTTEPWFDGPGGVIMQFPQAGLLIVWHTARTHREIRTILADQRRLMRVDGPNAEELAEVAVRGYELNHETATDLVDLLPEVIAPDTWRTDEHPERIGWIRVVSLGHQRWSGHGHGSGSGFFSTARDGDASGAATVEGSREKYGMLIIRQTRATHHQIANWLEALHSATYRDRDSVIPSVDLSGD